MASLEYVTAGWLRSRRLTVASVGAGRGCGGLCPWPLPCQGGGLGPGDFLPSGGRLGRRGGCKPWLHSRGKLPSVFGASVGLVLVGAEADGVGAGELRGVAFWLVGGATALVQLLLAVPDHLDLWPPVVPQVAEAVLNCALTHDPVARVVVAKGLLDLHALLESWVHLGWGRCWLWEGG